MILYLGLYPEKCNNANGFMQFYHLHKALDPSNVIYCYQKDFYFTPMRMARFFRFIIPKFLPHAVDTLVFDSNPWLVLHWSRIISIFSPRIVIYRQSDAIGRISGNQSLIKAEQSLIDYADKIFLVNESQKLKLYKEQSKCIVIPNGLRKQSRYTKNKENIVFYYGKFPISFDELYRAAHENPNLQFIIAGDYSFPSTGRSSNINFIGYLNHEQIESHIESAKFFYLPYADVPGVEDLGVTNKILHALSAGCTIVLGDKVNRKLFVDIPYENFFEDRVIKGDVINDILLNYSWENLFKKWRKGLS